MRIGTRAVAWVLMGLVGCGRVGAPRTVTDRLDGWLHDDAGAVEATEAEPPEAGTVGVRSSAFVLAAPLPREAREDEELIVIEDEPLPGSRRLLETATVHAEPSAASPMLAMVIGGTRLGVLGRSEAPGCAGGWWEVAPRGFVCARTEPSDEAPTKTMLPRVPGGALVPGVYGKVQGDAQIFDTRDAAARGVGGRRPARKLTVHRLSRETIGGQAFWRTREGFIPEAQIRRHRGSSFAGVRLDEVDAPALPLAWALARPGAERSSVAVHAAPRAGSKVVGRLSPRTVVSVGPTEHGFVQVGDGWIAAADLRVARRTEAPRGVGEGERWVDIDLGQQVLVAYEGGAPLYATMISSGRAGHRTPTGVYRIERKVAERTMNSMSDSDEEYRVAKVPWTAYFATGYALHAAYWHDGFGRPRSHGCVNLAPRDARELYAFLAPAVEPGYAEIYGHEAQPGSTVRVRSSRDPSPELQGYARTLAEAADAGATRVAALTRPTG